jgi:LysM repeat protein
MAPAASAAPTAPQSDPEQRRTAAVKPVSQQSKAVQRHSKRIANRRLVHVVVRGETLSGIAATAHLSWPCVARTNHLANPDLIHPGQRIQLSCKGGTAVHTPKSTLNKPRRYYYRDSDGRLRWTAHYAKYLQHKYDFKAPSHKTSGRAKGGSGRSGSRAPVASGNGKAFARSIMSGAQFQCFDNIVKHESGWNPRAVNRSSGAYGLVQAVPGSKMASAGSDWQTNPATQIKWGLRYMNSRYGSPCAAWSFWLAHKWY